MNTGFTAPVGESKRIDDVELIPQGFQLCTMVSLIDVGHQETKFGVRRMCKMMFEFPQHLRVFWEGDPPRPSCIIISETLSLGQGSNLRDKWIPQMFGRKISDDEAKTFDISQFLGKHFVATIAHSGDGKYANITAITPLTMQNCGMFQLTSPHTEQITDTTFFHMSQGFDSENFASLSKGFRKMVIESTEGQAHANAGGTFREALNQGPSNTTSQGKIVWLEQGTTYEQYKQAGWTDDQLVQNGKMRIEQPVAPPPVTNVAPPPTANVVAPPPTVAQPPQANTVTSPPPPPAGAVATPVPPKKQVLVFKDPTHTLEAFKAQGWTEEEIVAEGYATFQ